MESVGSIVEAKTKFLNRMTCIKALENPAMCIISRYDEAIIIVARNVRSTVKCVQLSSAMGL